MKYFLIYLFIFILFFLSTRTARANVYVADESAVLKSSRFVPKDSRVEKLETFLLSHNSPLAKYSDKFVEVADKYNIDWRLIPAITGVESTFGKRIPQSSYNAYGWANGKYRFSSWDESIEVVGKTLREKYYNKGTPTINLIARRYAPPSSTWAGNVKYFMAKIDEYPVYFSL